MLLVEGGAVMNRITFGQYLEANGLPMVGETVTTPRGDKVEVVAYVFDEYRDSVKVRLVEFDCVVRWDFDQIRQCTWEEE
jgi:hypothetical protein